MAIRQTIVDTATKNGAVHGGDRHRQFAALFLQERFRVSAEVAHAQTNCTNSNSTVDAFHFDPERRCLYLLIARWARSYEVFREPMLGLAEGGVEKLLAIQDAEDPAHKIARLLKDRETIDPQFRERLQSTLFHNQELLRRVCISFVFNGDAAEADDSELMTQLRSDLRQRQYVLEPIFGRPIELATEFWSAALGTGGRVARGGKTFHFDLVMPHRLTYQGPSGAAMLVGLVSIKQLSAMYDQMGQDFLDKNVRSGLSPDSGPNRSILEALDQMVLKGETEATAFPFHHNGVTLYADACVPSEDVVKLTEPRLLNGAQSVTTFHRFLKSHTGRKDASFRQRTDAISVLCKVISGAPREFITAVTINNNRQNPVEPWNLRANDLIQVELQDWFARKLGIYYERQENAFSNLQDDDLDRLNIQDAKALELLRVAQTYLACEGLVDKMTQMRRVFEDDRWYSKVFHRGRLAANPRHVVLCYKIQLRIRKLLQEIQDRGHEKYQYIFRARNLVWALLCQAVLNDDQLTQVAIDHGEALSISAEYTDWLASLVSRRVRPLVSGVMSDERYAAAIREERYEFLRSNAVYDQCMAEGRSRYGWSAKTLRQATGGT